MESHTFSKANAATRPRLYSIVHTYIQKQLPRDIHPAFKALRDHEEEAATSPQIGSTEEKTLPLLAEQEQPSRVDHFGVFKDYDDDLPLYAASQVTCGFMVDPVK